MTITSNVENIESVFNKAGKYLTFELANEVYGLEILKVREIIGYRETTTVPQVPDYVKGIINLRGKVIPIIDIRNKFHMSSAEVTEQTCIVFVDTLRGCQKHETGIIVDNVLEVLDIKSEMIDDAPDFGSAIKTDFILGISRVADDIKILLNIDKVLDDEVLGSIHES